MDYNLIGAPFNYQRVVSSGGGGNTTCTILVPAGQIWIIKFATAYHTDASGARVIVWNLEDLITAITIQLPGGGSVAANIRADYPYGTYHKGPIMMSPGGIRLGIVVQALAAATNAIVEVHGHRISGVSPLV